MTESQIETASIAPLHRRVFWLGVIASFFAAGCALGVVFGILYHNYVSEQPASALQVKAVRLTMIGIVQKGVMTLAFAYLSRSLLRYASLLKRIPTEDATLTKAQTSCWEAAIWLALLFTGWELTSALVGAMQ